MIDRKACAAAASAFLVMAAGPSALFGSSALARRISRATWLEMCHPSTALHSSVLFLLATAPPMHTVPLHSAAAIEAWPRRCWPADIRGDMRNPFVMGYMSMPTSFTGR